MFELLIHRRKKLKELFDEPFPCGIDKWSKQVIACERSLVYLHFKPGTHCLWIKWFTGWHNSKMCIDLLPSAFCGICVAGARAGFDSDALPSPPQLWRHGQLSEFKPWASGGRRRRGGTHPDPWDWAPRPTRPLLLHHAHGQLHGLPVTPNLHPKLTSTCPSAEEHRLLNAAMLRFHHWPQTPTTLLPRTLRLDCAC